MKNPRDEFATTYSSLGSTGVFDGAANGEHLLLTPFAVPSWEPRFAVDSISADAATIAAAIGFSLRLHLWKITGDERFAVYEFTKTRLVLFRKGSSSAGRIREERVLLPEAAITEAAEAVAAWLQVEAEYPPSPWFEGSEARGFQMFDIPFQAPPRECYGGLIVEPKWFEVHK